MQQLNRHYRVIFARVLVGVIAYSLFFLGSSVAVITRTMEVYGAPLVICLVLALVLMPRRPGFQGELELSEENEEAVDAILERLERIKVWSTWARLIFFFGALLTMLVLPEILG